MQDADVKPSGTETAVVSTSSFAINTSDMERLRSEDVPTATTPKNRVFISEASEEDTTLAVT